MGTRIVEIDTNGNTLRTLASSTGAYFPNNGDIVLGNERKRANAETFIARAKRNADTIEREERKQAGRRNEQQRTLQALAASLPDGYSVEFDDAGVPTSLVAPEEQPSDAEAPPTAVVEPEPTAVVESASEPEQAASPTDDKPNKFDAIALAEAAK